jgi:hypothetical protein
MTRTPLPPDFTKAPCDPCVELRVKVKLFRRLLAAMVSEAGGEKYIALGEESAEDDIDIVRCDKSGSWKLTTV